MGESILGVVLAGGLATRMGGTDKGLLSLGHRTILDEVLNRLSPQVDVMIINANGDPGSLFELHITVRSRLDERSPWSPCWRSRRA